MAKETIKLTEKDLTRIVKTVLQEVNLVNHKKDTKVGVDNSASPDVVNGFCSGTECEPLTYDYLIDRHKGLPKKYFEPTNIPYSPSEFAIYDLPLEDDEAECLEEGMIKTYPTSKTLEYVCKELTNKGYPITPNQFQVNTPNDDKSIYGHILLMVSLNYLNKEIDTILKDCFNLCGYHLGVTFNRVDANNNPCIVYQFEPKFQTNKTNTVLGRYLYHVTTANAANKILKQGFCPSNRGTKTFKYDARCYFFTVYNKEQFRSYMQEAAKQNRNGANSVNNDFKIITIDRVKCKNVVFYTDPNFSNDVAVFTYDNIPPSAITRCEDL